MLKIFLCCFVITSITFGQENLVSLPNNTFTSKKLIEGVPPAVKRNNYFLQPGSANYAVIYHTGKDSLYFVTRQISADSAGYLMIYANSSRVIRYQFLYPRKINNDFLSATINFELPGKSISPIELFIQQNNEIVYYKFIRPNPFIINNTNFRLGIRDEFDVMFSHEINYGYETSTPVNLINATPLPINFHVVAGVGFLKYYNVDFRIGLTFIDEDFLGFDEGLFLQRQLFNTNFFGTVGLDFINDFGTAHNGGGSGGDFTFYCLGAGYKTSKNFNLDLTFYIPNNRVYGYNIDDYFPYGKRSNKINYGIVQVGFQYTFIL